MKSLIVALVLALGASLGIATVAEAACAGGDTMCQNNSRMSSESAKRASGR